MSDTPEAIPLDQLSGFGRDLSERLDRPLAVTVEGETVAVILAVADYSRLVKEREVLR